MTLAEEREKLIETMADVLFRHEYGATAGLVAEKDWAIGQGLEWPTCTIKKLYCQATEILPAISAAGFSIVGPEVTLEMLDAATRHFRKHGYAEEIFKAMLAAGDLGKAKEMDDFP